MKEIDGGVAAPVGFVAGAVAAGIKYKKRNDLAMVVSESPAVVAGVFTQSSTKSPTVDLCKKIIATPGRNMGRAIIVNSGNANAATGEKGKADAFAMASFAENAINAPPHSVFVASTGVIGELLPMEKIEKAIPALSKSLSANGGKSAAMAIMTTDTSIKEIAYAFELGGSTVRIGAMAKGSGMIAPNMATMLGFITTDASIEYSLLQNILSDVVGKTFNMITVDGDTSTNDMVLVMANGASKAPSITPGSREEVLFRRALDQVCHYLALEIVKDGEGITKLVTVNVKNGATFEDAKNIAFSVADSKLVKVALFAEDANWGRIIMAVGKSDARVDIDRLDIFFDDEPICVNGVGLGPEAEEKVSGVLKQSEFSINIDLKLGDAEASVYTTDLSHEYIKINAEYRT